MPYSGSHLAELLDLIRCHFEHVFPHLAVPRRDADGQRRMRGRAVETNKMRTKDTATKSKNNDPMDAPAIRAVARGVVPRHPLVLAHLDLLGRVRVGLQVHGRVEVEALRKAGLFPLVDFLGLLLSPEADVAEPLDFPVDPEKDRNGE